MMRSVTSLLSRKEPLASSEDIRRRPHRASCSDAVGLTDAADGATAKRRCLRSRLLAAAIRAWMNWFWSLREGSEAAARGGNVCCGGGAEVGEPVGFFWVPLDPIHYGPVYSWPRFVMAPSSCSFVFSSLLKKNVFSSHIFVLSLFSLIDLSSQHFIGLQLPFWKKRKNILQVQNLYDGCKYRSYITCKMIKWT